MICHSGGEIQPFVALRCVPEHWSLVDKVRLEKSSLSRAWKKLDLDININRIKNSLHIHLFHLALSDLFHIIQVERAQRKHLGKTDPLNLKSDSTNLLPVT